MSSYLENDKDKLFFTYEALNLLNDMDELENIEIYNKNTEILLVPFKMNLNGKSPFNTIMLFNEYNDTGTSQATAFVTGVAALIKAEYPQLSTEKIKEIIKASARKEITMEGKCVTGGRLDAGSALALASQMAGETETKRQLATAESKES